MKTNSEAQDLNTELTTAALDDVSGGNKERDGKGCTEQDNKFWQMTDEGKEAR